MNRRTYDITPNSIKMTRTIKTKTSFFRYDCCVNFVSKLPFMLTSVLLDERTIPQPACGTLLPCRKGEGKGMRVAIARPDTLLAYDTG